ncbi:MAG: DUF4388 domain-containing protein [Myxococcales bacterium]|nr:DUF4388 domain-containing protein [Myxococcales bacterium]
MRQGNLSATGMYFETLESIGPAGSVQFLHIESEDHRVVVQVLARIIRTSAISDIIDGEKVGLAMEFMPSSSRGRTSLERLVRHVVELGLRHKTSVDHHFDVDVSGSRQGDRTSLQHLSVQKLTLETDWRANVGDPMVLQIRSPHEGTQSFPLLGQVTSVDPAEEGYRVEVRITGLSAAAVEETVPNATMGSLELDEEVDMLTDLLTHPMEDFALPAPEHLSGMLSRIKLPTILGLMEMERMSGELRFNAYGQNELVLYIADGRPVDLVDVKSEGTSPRELLGRLMGWSDGEFHFFVEEVKREDRFGTSMTSLVLDLARAEDEAAHDTDITESETDFF